MTAKQPRKSATASDSSKETDRRILCTPKRLPRKCWERAAQKARQINPLNYAPVHRLTRVMPEFAPNKERLAVVTTKYWGNQGVRLTVGFLDNPDSETRRKIMENLNAWSNSANVRLVQTKTDPQSASHGFRTATGPMSARISWIPRSSVISRR